MAYLPFYWIFNTRYSNHNKYLAPASDKIKQIRGGTDHSSPCAWTSKMRIQSDEKRFEPSQVLLFKIIWIEELPLFGHKNIEYSSFFIPTDVVCLQDSKTYLWDLAFNNGWGISDLSLMLTDIPLSLNLQWFMLD